MINISENELKQIMEYLGCVDKSHTLKSNSIDLIWLLEEKLKQHKEHKEEYHVTNIHGL